MAPMKQTHRRKNLFLPGQKAWNKGLKTARDKSSSNTRYVRLTKDDFSRTTLLDERGNFLHRSGEMAEQTSTVMLLRPKAVEDPVPLTKMLASPSGAAVGHRIVDLEKLTEAMNEANRQHMMSSRGCKEMKWVIPEETEEKRGIAVTAKLKCSRCGFQSTAQKFFKEIEDTRRGRKTAVPNMALQVGLYQASISNTAATRILTAMSIPTGAMSGLQKTANKCGQIMKESNENDMAQKRVKIKDVLEWRGMERNAPIIVEMDRQYNNPLSAGKGRTPFAPATQARDVVVENVTPEKYIIAYNSTNKLCRIGQRLVAQGKEPTCPSHPKCTATIKMSNNIGDEMLGGQICAEKLLTNDDTQTLIKGIVTDSDGHFARGVQKVMQEKAGLETTSYLCVNHIKRSLCRKLEKLSVTSGFPGRTVRLRKKQHASMAGDITHRVQAELNAAHQLSSDILLCENQLQKCGEAILLCYTGNHQLCQNHSLVCNGSYNFPFFQHW